MQQMMENKINTTTELITYIANEYIIPVFMSTLLFGPIINAFLWLTDNDPAISGVLHPLATSTITITQTTGDILAVLLIIATASITRSKISSHKQTTTR